MIRNLNQLVELVATLYCMSILFSRKMKFDFYAIAYFFINIFIFTGINEYNFPLYFVILAYLCLFLYALLSYGKSIRMTFVNCFLTAVVMSILQMVVYLPIYYLFVKQRGINEIYELLINVICLGILFVLGKQLRLKELSEFLLKRNWLLLCISVFIMVCLGSGLYQLKKYIYLSGKDYLEILCFLLLLIFTIREWQKTKIDGERKRIQLEMNELYYAAYDELLNLVREQQHDMKNHINALFGMIYTIDNYDDLVQKQKEYCKYLVDKTAETKLLLSVENPLLTGFLYRKIQEAEEQGIKVKYRMAIEQKRNNISEYEMVELIGILVDNAIEALRSQADNMKELYVAVETKERNIDILVANSSKIISGNKIEEFFQRDFSSKGKGRGIGLSKLKKLVQEKNGEIVVSNEIYENINFIQFLITLPVR